MNNNNNNKYVKMFIYIALALFILVNFLIEEPLRVISIVVTATVIIETIYCMFLWRFNPFEKTPRLRKKYFSDWKSSDGGREYRSEVTIKQTLFSVKMRETWTDNRGYTECYSLASTLKQSDAGSWFLYCICYRHTYPKDVEQRGDEAHHVAYILRINDKKAYIMEGNYFSNRRERQTHGNIRLSIPEVAEAKIWADTSEAVETKLQINVPEINESKIEVDPAEASNNQ